jgi:formamidopyrimidine-DNA glycosylase
MPELPEVETVRRILATHTRGCRIQSVTGANVMMRRPLDINALQRVLPGRTLVEPRRRGKFLLLDTDPTGSLLVHLGMSGRLMLQAPGDACLPHTHLTVELEDGRELRLVDPRRFGLVTWLDPGAEADDPSLAALGIEPLEGSLRGTLPGLVAGRRAPIKALLLDQRLVAGIGNIYANEALWRAGILPTRAANRISRTRLKRLAVAVEEVLTEAVAQGGTTIRDFATPEGNFGYFQVRLAVYGRSGEPCPRCGAGLRDAMIGQRATVWCPSCQR